MYKFNLSFGVGLQEHIIPAGLCLIWYECRPPGWVGYETPAAAGLLSFTELVGTDSAIKAFPLFTCSVTLLPFAILGLRQQWKIKFIFYYYRWFMLIQRTQHMLCYRGTFQAHLILLQLSFKEPGQKNDLMSQIWMSFCTKCCGQTTHDTSHYTATYS